jgi:serine/threonine protein kinase
MQLKGEDTVTSDVPQLQPRHNQDLGYLPSPISDKRMQEKLSYDQNSLTQQDPPKVNGVLIIQNIEKSETSKIELETPPGKSAEIGHATILQSESPNKVADTHSDGLRKQEGAGDCGDWASYMKLSHFHEINCRFHWPNSEGSQGVLPNSLQLNEKPIPIPGWQGNIGSTGTAIVSAYRVTKEFGFEDSLAVKDIRCKQQDKKDQVRDEVEILKDLKHDHVIAFLGTYIRDENIGILMFPVASYNLRTFMELVSDHNRNSAKPSGAETHEQTDEHVHCGLLRRYFACLCQGLLYLHRDMKIKHKDIKPDNILIDRHDSIIITDFGISTRHTEDGDAITVGPTGFTVQYAAPEIKKDKPRDLNIDVFSLGCVFLEMANVIYGETFQSMYRFLVQSVTFQLGKEEVNYFDCPGKVREWVSMLRQKKGPWTFVCPESLHLGSPQHADSSHSTNAKIFDMILKMMSTEPNDRPGLQEVWGLFDLITPPCADCHPKVSALRQLEKELC